MSLLRTAARNHPQQVRKHGADDSVDDRETGADTFAECVERFGEFDLDVAAASHNTKCERFYSLADDGLSQPWDGVNVWCNPPFSDLRSWVAKASDETASGRAGAVTLLLPANRSEQGWWQELIEPVRDRPGSGVTTHFMHGRRRFIRRDVPTPTGGDRPPFGIVLVRFEAKADAPVLAATAWPTNGHLVADLFRLGYLLDDDLILDPTFHRGTWWTQVEPRYLITYSNEPTSEAYAEGHDFTAMGFPDGLFDAVAFDPPYVSKGGRSTSGIRDMDDRYGQHDAPASPAALQTLIEDGLTECVRVTKRRGIVVVKCMDYVSSGRLWSGTYLTHRWALTLGCEVVDRLEHLGTPGPQPPGRRQVHARRNLSTLLVLRTPK